jgi:hypothetical protein
MLYTVSEISDLINLSKVSIYKKLKLKEFESHVTQKQGITYIDEVGFNLIKDSLKLKEDVKTGLNNDNIDSELNTEISIDSEDLTINKELVKTLIEQLKVKDLQIRELNDRLSAEQDLHKNTQIILKSEQDKPKQDLLLLEEHVKEFEGRLAVVKENMEQRKETRETKGIFNRFLKKNKEA